MYDINTQIPAFVHITPTSVHDMNAMDALFYESYAYYILDRGYVDYTMLNKITQHSATFVVRAKSNLKFNRMYSRKHDKSTGIKSDQIYRLTGFYVSKQCPEKLRKIKFHD